MSTCPELTFGVFSRPTLAEAKQSSTPPKHRLLAHILATGTSAPVVTDAAMTVPKDWKSKSTTVDTSSTETVGHEQKFRTVAIHSLAVLPEHRNKKLGSMLLLAYIERIKTAKIADRIALLAHEDLIPFYEKLGFKNSGESKAQFGGGNWSDVVSSTSHTTNVDGKLTVSRFSNLTIWLETTMTRRSRILPEIGILSSDFAPLRSTRSDESHSYRKRIRRGRAHLHPMDTEGGTRRRGP